MTRALIIADIEGIIDVYDLQDSEKCSELYTREISIYTNALLKNNINDITICDIHDKGDMINPCILEMGIACESQIQLVSRVENIRFDEKYDFAILV